MSCEIKNLERLREESKYRLRYAVTFLPFTTLFFTLIISYFFKDKKDFSFIYKTYLTYIITYFIFLFSTVSISLEECKDINDKIVFVETLKLMIIPISASLVGLLSIYMIYNKFPNSTSIFPWFISLSS
jgi:hypothetical protein